MDLEILIPISLFFVIAYIIKVISDNRVRHRLISVGGMFLFAGLALIIYYSFARKVIGEVVVTEQD